MACDACSKMLSRYLKENVPRAADTPDAKQLVEHRRRFLQPRLESGGLGARVVRAVPSSRDCRCRFARRPRAFPCSPGLRHGASRKARREVTLIPPAGAEFQHALIPSHDHLGPTGHRAFQDTLVRLVGQLLDPRGAQRAALWFTGRKRYSFERILTCANPQERLIYDSHHSTPPCCRIAAPLGTPDDGGFIPMTPVPSLSNERGPARGTVQADAQR
jgi:hypothetical protein